MTEESQPKENRRREDRERVDGAAEVHVIDAPHPGLDGSRYMGTVYDTSRSGLRLHCRELLDGCTLTLRVKLKGAADAVTLTGDVLWASMEDEKEYQMGVELSGNDEATLAAWYEALDQ